MNDAAALLADNPLFAGFGAVELEALARMARPVHIGGGGVLFYEGSAPDAFYLVISGRLCAVIGDDHVAGEIARTESIGEIGVISGAARNATVYALRDSWLLRIARDDLMRVVTEHPSALLTIIRVVISRLKQTPHDARLAAARRSRAITVVPARAGLDVQGFTHRLVTALDDVHGRGAGLVGALQVDSALGAGASRIEQANPASVQVSDWLARLETRYRHLLYQANDPVAGAGTDAWTLRALRQADRVLLLVDSTDLALDSAVLEAFRALPRHAPLDVVLLRPDGAPAGPVAAWRRLSQAQGHYFVRPPLGPGAMGDTLTRVDTARLARQLGGHGVGLVLGGGGARGFAHIGLVRALAELDLPVDLAGGSSMGAFFAALLATGADWKDMRAIAHDTFVSHNYLNDYVLPIPRVSLIKGRKFLGRLRQIFGGQTIEGLRTPFFCVSTNLTRGQAFVHDEGELAMAIATSMCVPGYAPPVGYNGDLLADGAVINSLPTDVMEGLGRGPIIASDVSTEGDVRAPGVVGFDPEVLLRPQNPATAVNLVDVLFRTATLTSESGVRARARRADCYLRMPVGDSRMFDWSSLDTLIERGYRHAMAEPQRAALLALAAGQAPADAVTRALSPREGPMNGTGPTGRSAYALADAASLR